jgi:hypothetical protein
MSPIYFYLLGLKGQPHLLNYVWFGLGFLVSVDRCVGGVHLPSKLFKSELTHEQQYSVLTAGGGVSTADGGVWTAGGGVSWLFYLLQFLVAQAMYVATVYVSYFFDKF